MPLPTLASKTMQLFQSGSSNYEPTIAWWLAHCSGLAYQAKPDIAKALQGAGFSAVTFFEMRGTLGYLATHPGIASHHGFAVLAFRGTMNDYMNIFTDVMFVKRPITDENVRAHGGFVTALSDVWGTSLDPKTTVGIDARLVGAEGVSNVLDSLPKELPCYFTGHSLGAALATLAAEKHRPTAFYTFGSPRVGGKDFADNMKRKGIPSYRVVNSTDIITRFGLPPRYWHIDTIVYLTRGERVMYPPSGKSRILRQLEFLREVLSLFTLIDRFNLLVNLIKPRIFTNHKITEYIRKLEANL